MKTFLSSDGFTLYVTAKRDAEIVVEARFKLPTAPHLYAPRAAWVLFHDACDQVRNTARAYRAELDSL